MKKILLLFTFTLMLADLLYAQGKRNEDKILTFETIYDTPYEINKLWIGFQPLYTDMFRTNANLGYGFEATYYWKDKADFRVHFRKPYNRHLDLQRNVAFTNAEEIQNRHTIFNFMEFGGTYHIKDTEQDTESLIYLYSKRYAGAKWASMVPDKSKVQTKVRKIIGVRAGAFAYQTTVDLDRMYDKREITLNDAEGVALPNDWQDTPGGPDLNPFTGARVKGGYIGGSHAWIKNFAINPDRTYDDLVKDLIFTVYGDILIAGSINYEDVYYRPDPEVDPVAKAYSTKDLGKNFFGFRAGIDGKFNRTLSWGYNGEIGYRPGVSKQGLYALIKITFPMYSTDMNNNVEAFSK